MHRHPLWRSYLHLRSSPAISKLALSLTAKQLGLFYPAKLSKNYALPPSSADLQEHDVYFPDHASATITKKNISVCFPEVAKFHDHNEEYSLE